MAPEADVFGIWNFVVVRTGENETSSGFEASKGGGNRRFRLIEMFQEFAHEDDIK